MAVTVRPEDVRDREAVHALHRAAFEPYGGEAELVEALRESAEHVPELCLVAVVGDRVAGHIFFSRARLDSGHPVLALAPMAVHPSAQRQGIGSALVRQALQAAATTRYPLVVVLGHPEYYPRFGFEPAAELGVLAPWDVPPAAWMARRLPAYDPAARGLLTYAAAFDAAR